MGQGGNNAAGHCRHSRRASRESRQSAHAYRVTHGASITLHIPHANLLALYQRTIDNPWHVVAVVQDFRVDLAVVA